MRLALLALLTPTVAAAEPLWAAEVRAGYGVSMSSSSGMLGARTSPLTLGANVAVATRVDPPLSVVGGLFVEALDRTSVGVNAGLRLTVADSLRLTGGVATVVAPYTLWGATLAAGTCLRTSAKMSLCGDVELTSYLAGNDLPEDGAVTQVQLIGAVRFDAP